MSHVETITDTAEFNAPASAVWELLTDWAAIADWMPDCVMKWYCLSNTWVVSLSSRTRGPALSLAANRARFVGTRSVNFYVRKASNRFLTAVSAR